MMRYPERMFSGHTHNGSWKGAFARAGLVVALLLLASCVTLLQGERYRVEAGDTLYSIAWRYHVDWHYLAKWNHISPPYRIRVGQVIALSRTAAAGMSGKRVARTPQPQSSASGTPARQAEPTTTAQKNTRKTAQRTTSQLPGKVGHWQWPAKGAVIHNYKQSRPRHGIDIGGKLGQPVVAASGGTVVYSGSGLKGYGNLIIIKHSPHYLSAYGFNQRLLAKEGDRVTAGQTIAEMGNGPGDVPMLHFEIRHNGKPVDPEKLLPNG